MGIWRKIGISEASVDDIDDESCGLLLGSRGTGAGTPLLLEPNSVEDLVAYLLELESPDRGSPGYAKLRTALLASATELETASGERVIALTESADRFVRERTSEFMHQDRHDLLSLGSELGLAAQTLSEDGRVFTSSSGAEASWARAADAMESFLAMPRRRGRFDLEDLFMSVDGIHALANCIELLRRLLLAAGLALDTLGAATLGHRDLSGVDGAIALWKVSEGIAARRLAKSLAELASRTPELSERGEVGCVRPGTGDTAWIESCSQLGQDVLRWVYDRGQATLTFAGAVGAAWPGPGLYGYDDGEKEPGRARALCAAFEYRRDPEHPPLFGTHEATVSQDLVVPIPETLLEGADHLFVTEGVEEPGGSSASRCPATSQSLPGSSIANRGSGVIPGRERVTMRMSSLSTPPARRWQSSREGSRSVRWAHVAGQGRAHRFCSSGWATTSRSSAQSDTRSMRGSTELNRQSCCRPTTRNGTADDPSEG